MHRVWYRNKVAGKTLLISYSLEQSELENNFTRSNRSSLSHFMAKHNFETKII
jgi:hypothetical protein